MSLESNETSTAWGSTSTTNHTQDDSVSAVIEKENLVKSVTVSLQSTHTHTVYSQITSMQQGLRGQSHSNDNSSRTRHSQLAAALLERVSDVQNEGFKLKAGNQTLQTCTYIIHSTLGSSVELTARGGSRYR